jgi:hypothetical protein
MKTNSPSVPKDETVSFILHPSLSLFMISVFAATATELAKLKPIRRGLFILGRYVIAALACTTLKNNIIAWHNSILIFLLVGLRSLIFGR